MTYSGWVGVDLDGTLAEYHGWNDHEIGAPIVPMVDLVKRMIASGVEVRVFTARAYKAEPEHISLIQDWTEKHIGHRLAVTATKDYTMIALYDDRCVQVEMNTGRILVPSSVLEFLR